MRGFPGFVNQKMGGPAPPPPIPSAPSLAALPRPPVLNAPTMPAVPMLARPTVPVVPTPVVVAPPAAPPAPTLRPVTVATVTRNLQAALGPDPQPGVPTTQGFPGFVSRNFNQVSQHQPTASNSNMLNNLANMFNNAGPAAPERRQAPRPLPVARPTPAPEARAAVPPKPPVTLAQPPALLKKPEPPKALEVARPAAQAPVPQPQAKAQPAPQPKPEARPAEKPPQPQAAPTAKAPAPPKPALELPKPAAPEPPKAKPLAQEEEKKTPVLAAATPVRSPKPAESKAPARPAEIKPLETRQVENKSQSVEAPRLEAKAPTAESRPVRELDQPKENKESKNNERVEGPARVGKAQAPQAPQSQLQSQKVEKLAQTRQENTELKVGEVQRQQISDRQVPMTREQLELAQQAGAGVSAGGGGGNGGGGGQQRQQRRDQNDEQSVEEVAGAEALGGDDQVQWWHLRGAEDNLRVLSSELREAIFNLRTPERKLGVEPRQLRSQQRVRREELAELPQTVVERKQEQQQNIGDQVQLQAEDLCQACGLDLNGVDARRCPNCVRQAALRTLALLEADPHFIAYRVFLTICRQPVSSQAVYRLRDFTRLPSGAYCVQAA